MQPTRLGIELAIESSILLQKSKSKWPCYPPECRLLTCSVSCFLYVSKRISVQPIPTLWLSLHSRSSSRFAISAPSRSHVLHTFGFRARVVVVVSMPYIYAANPKSPVNCVFISSPEPGPHGISQRTSRSKTPGRIAVLPWNLPLCVDAERKPCTMLYWVFVRLAPNDGCIHSPTRKEESGQPLLKSLSSRSCARLLASIRNPNKSACA